MYKLLLYLFLFFLLPFFVAAQQFNYVHYDTKDGLAGSTVYDMCQDKDGFMWFATENGLSRYDGTSFKNFTVKDGLPDNEVLKIFADSKGRLWIGTFNKEISYYFKGKIFNKLNDTLVKQIVLENFLTTAAEDDNGTIALTDAKKIILLQPSGKATRVSGTKIPGKEVSLYKYNKWGKITASNESLETYVYENGSFKYLLTYPGQYSISKLTEADRWIMIKIDLDSKEILKLKTKPGFININRVNDFTAFYTSTDGVWSVDTVNIKWDLHFLPGKKITRTFEDKEKNLWFSTIGDGIYKLPSKETRTIQFASIENSSGNEVFSLLKVKHNLVCGIGFGKAAVLYKDSISKIEDYSSVNASTGFRTKTNRLYCSTILPTGIAFLGFDNFLVKLENGKPTFNFIYPVKSVEAIDNNNIIVGTSSIAVKMKVSDMKITDTIWRERCSKVFYHNNKYYIGTLGGLYEVNADKSYKYLGDLHPSLKRRITDIKATANGTLWIATSDEGLVAYNGTIITSVINDTNGLSSNICKTLFLKDHYLWVGTNKGLNKIDIGREDHPVLKYSSSDGLPSDIINSVYAEDSMVYVGSPAGLTFFKENKISNTSVCDLRMLSVTVSGTALPADSNYRLTYKNNNIRFAFTAISFKSGGDITYHYKLSGLDEDWQQTTQNFLEYPSLPSDNYALQLYATNKFGVQSETITIHFSIGAPFWKTWWFYTLLLMAAIGLTGWLVNSRNKKQRLKLEERNRQDKQFAALEQQALQAQMNPHFIFNCLNSIQQYILTNNKEKANEYLTGFASLIRQTLDNSNKKTITVAEEVQYLTRYLEMERMRFGDNFSYHISTDGSADTGNLEIPALLLQPYVENCLRHGIRYKTDASGKVNIVFTRTAEALYCSITDNGIGRKKAAEIKNSGHIEYQSKGMSLTAKRIELLNKMNENKTSVTINDVTDAAGNAVGTEVIVKISL